MFFSQTPSSACLEWPLDEDIHPVELQRQYLRNLGYSERYILHEARIMIHLPVLEL